MKISLILARHEEDLDQYPPLGLGYLAAVIRKKYPAVELEYCNSLKGAALLRPDLALISSASANYDIAAQMAAMIKRRRSVPVIIGGVHISTLPQSLQPVFDAGMIGEGEGTVLELIAALQKDGELQRDHLMEIPGLALHGPDGIQLTGERELIDDMDTIPHPDREFLGFEGGSAHILTSRGCPYRCSFCSSAAHWKTYRTFSIPYVMEEIDDLVNRLGVRQIHIYDDLFTANKKRLRQFAEMYRERGYENLLTISCAVRANLVDEEAAELLSSMKFDRLTFGAESMSDKVLPTLKPNVTVEDNRRAVDIACDHGIKVGLSFVVGAPGEKREDLVATYLYILRSVYLGKIDQADVNVLSPFPATPMWDKALEQNLVSDSMDWESLRTPWRDLILNEDFKREGVRALLYDLKVKRMLQRLRTPVTLLAGLQGSESSMQLSALSHSQNLFTSAYLFDNNANQTREIEAGGWWPVASTNQQGFNSIVERDPDLPGIRPILVLVNRAEDLFENPDLVRYLIWTHFEEENDLTILDGIPGMAATSLLVGQLLVEEGWPGSDVQVRLKDFTGFKASEIKYNPARFAFAEDIFPGDLPPDLVFRDLVDLYAGMFTEKTLYANLQSRMEQDLVRLQRELENRPPAGDLQVTDEKIKTSHIQGFLAKIFSSRKK